MGNPIESVVGLAEKPFFFVKPCIYPGVTPATLIAVSMHGAVKTIVDVRIPSTAMSICTLLGTTSTECACK
ncbi:hypothetical protein N8703_04225 [Verrucomicrobia bacterium]|nr:hypothetical protein [Verrucomicrobiota bacterium]